MNFAILSKALDLPNRALVQAINQFTTLERLFNASTQELAALFDPPQLKAILRWQQGAVPETYAPMEAELNQLGAHTVSLGEPDYPALLAEIADPPPVLFVCGSLSCLQRPQIAIVGSRSCTAGGRRIAREFAADLASAGFCITSGLAAGIDAAAHQGALAGGGRTLAVMGAGPESIYPARHQPLAENIRQNGGALVTEFAPGTPPRAAHFPQRNRIVTGLSLGVLVVEAGERSGSLISARLGAEQGREVFAIPGSLLSPVSAGCNRLIREGATLATDPGQIAEQLGPMLDFQLQSQSPVAAAPEDQPPHWLLDKMGFEPVSVDELCDLCGCDSAQITRALAELELSGWVELTTLGYQRRA